MVEFLHGLDQAQVALLDQVQEQHAPAHIALGDGHHQTQVGLDQLFFGFFPGLQLRLGLGQLLIGQGQLPGLHLGQPLLGGVPGGHGGGQPDLLVAGQQGHLADLLQIHAHRVVDVEAIHQGVGVDQLLLLDLGDLLHGRLHVLGDVVGEILGDDVDAQIRQGVIDAVHLVAVQVHGVHHLGQLRRLQAALLLALDKQLPELLVPGQQRRRRALGQLLLQGLVRRGLCFLGLLGGGLSGLLLVVGGQQLVRHFLQLLLGINFIRHCAFLHSPFYFYISPPQPPGGPFPPRRCVSALLPG